MYKPSYLPWIAALLSVTLASTALAQSQWQQPGEPNRPNYELYRVDKLVSQGDVSYSGDMSLSIPLLSIPNMHGHSFEIALSYGTSVTQMQKASWVGLGWNLEVGAVKRAIRGRADDQRPGLPSGKNLGVYAGNNSPYQLTTDAYPSPATGRKAVKISGGQQRRLYQSLGTLPGGVTYTARVNAKSVGANSTVKVWLNTIPSPPASATHQNITTSWSPVDFSFALASTGTVYVGLEVGSIDIICDDVTVRNSAWTYFTVKNQSFENDSFLGYGPPTDWKYDWIPDRSEDWGRLALSHAENASKESADQADQYSLLMDGGGTEVFPFPDLINQRDTLTGLTFMPPQWQPWRMKANWKEGDGYIKSFEVRKEDGTKYFFGTMHTAADTAMSTGIDSMKVSGISTQSNTQLNTFPHRWNLTKIEYPDGIATTIKYKKINSFLYTDDISGGGFTQPWENLFVDRAYPETNGNLFGSSGYAQNAWGKVLHEYSHPDTIYTETYYAVFVAVTSPSGDDTEGNVKLSEIKLYNRETKALVKKVVFNYATNVNNASYYGHGNSPEPWDSNERLNDNQLTLISVTVYGSGSEYLPPYEFSYHENPMVHRQQLLTASASTPEFPGYHSSFESQGQPNPNKTDSVFTIAWKLKSLKLPSGATIAYDYQQLGSIYASPDSVLTSGFPWSFRAQPRAKLSKKTVTDPLGATQIWMYQYGPTVYDPPAALSSSSFIPKLYWNSLLGHMPIAEEYYKIFRGCGIGHRWVQVTNPDNTTRRVFYTSSYKGADANPMESARDSVVAQHPGTNPPYPKTMWSRAAKRGLVWKEVLNSKDSTINIYTFRLQGAMLDRYEYFTLAGPGNTKDMVEQSCYWARLDSTKTVKDGVSSSIAYQYNPTLREDGSGNGLITKTTEYGSTPSTGTRVDRVTEYEYAYLSYSQMGPAYGNMLSQLLRVSKKSKIGAAETELEKIKTPWAQIINNKTMPQGTNVWSTAYNGYLTKVYYGLYDIFGNVTKSNDNMAFTRFYFGGITYFDDGSGGGGNPRKLLSPEKKKPAPTGSPNAKVLLPPGDAYPPGTKPYQFAWLRKADKEIVYGTDTVRLVQWFEYDSKGNVKKRTDENGKVTEFVYDTFGRLVMIKGPNGQKLSEFSYYYAGSSLSSSNPNRITATTYRTATDSSVTKLFYDGTGYEIQRLILLGSEDIVSALAYDNMKRVDRAYKPYQMSVNHTYDPSFYTDAKNYYLGSSNPAYSPSPPYGNGQIDSPFTRTNYWPADGRVKNQYAPGSVFQAEANNRFVRTFYDKSVAADSTLFSAGELYRTTTIDENQVKHQEFRDKLGNLVQTMTDSGGSSSLRLTTRFQYDALGRRTKSTAPNGLASNYSYDTRGTVTGKVTPDAGTTQYLYDRNGNVRLIKDSSHTGTTTNNVSIFQDGWDNDYRSGSFTLNMPGKVDLVASISACEDTDNLQVVIKHQSTGIVIKSITADMLADYVTSSIVLPKGTYSYEMIAYDYWGACIYWQGMIACSKNYEFVYNKYDIFNRVTEVGEYYGPESWQFAQVYQGSADNAQFPTHSDRLITKTFAYDKPSTDPVASGQRNLVGRLSTSTAYRFGAEPFKSYYSYDDFGRVEWMIIVPYAQYAKKFTYSYDWQGNITRKGFIDLYTSANNYFTFYEYDKAGRLSKVSSGTDSTGAVKTTDAEYTYFPTGKLKRTRLGDAQGMDYRYNSRDWVTQINNQNISTSSDPGSDGTNGVAIDKFGMVLGYDVVAHIGSTHNGAAQYNGNVSWMMYQMSGVYQIASLVGYAFKYDNANRLDTANFGYYSGYWAQSSAYDIQKMIYDKSGNITTLKRYGKNATLMDDLTYQYITNTDKISYIDDSVSAGTYTVDIDDQSSGQYAYDGNGNVSKDLSSNIAFMVYDVNNLPVSVYMTNGTAHSFYHDANGTRFRKNTTYYLNGADGRTEVIKTNDNGAPTFQLHGNDHLGHVKKNGSAYDRYYYLKDHLGSNRMTVKGGNTTLTEAFNDLNQWTWYNYQGFMPYNGILVHTSSTYTSLLLSNASGVIDDGSTTVTVWYSSVTDPVAALLVRAQDYSFYYAIKLLPTQLVIAKHYPWTETVVASASISTVTSYTNYTLKVTTYGGTISVFWNGNLVVSYTDGSPFTSGKVGFRCGSNGVLNWDNLAVFSGGVGAIAAWDDFDPWGFVLDGRSGVSGSPDTRYKFTEKERDTETGLDYFGARMYDSRTGRWFSEDPMVDAQPSQSPYRYAFNNPLIVIDPNGREDLNVVRYARQNLMDLKYARGGFYYPIAGKESPAAWKMLDNRIGVCNEFVGRAYRESGHGDFPLTPHEQVEWFNSRSWATMNPNAGEVGDVIFFGKVNPIREPGELHEVIISAVKDWEDGSRKYRIMHLSGGEGKSREYEGRFYSMTELSEEFAGGLEFYAIGSVNNASRSLVYEENKQWARSRTGNSSPSAQEMYDSVQKK